ncbi:cupin domain-containing protein [Salinirubrum litoreum]|uniref:Cupin domain-containing protein n=1 Tax=Salinirubrum litoreum TaxID=1126234 RepID=A0ABD5RGV1_9EURY|nr:cupin domain-containing protein [Salinirubrum litoreum]
MSRTPHDTDLPEQSSDTDSSTTEYPRTVVDSSTGASITFRERGTDDRGSYLVMDGVLPPGVGSGPARIHPRAEAVSEVIEGRAVVTIRDEETVLLPGESVAIAAGDPHTIRNWDDASLVVRTTLRPPGEFESAIRGLYGLGAGGRPDLLGVAAVLYHHREDVQIAALPWRVQRPVLRLLTAVAGVLGRDPSADR